MKHLAALFILFLCSTSVLIAQSATDTVLQAVDSIRVKDSLNREQKIKDSIFKSRQEENIRVADSLKKAQVAHRKKMLANFQAVLKDHPFCNFYGHPERQVINIRKSETNDSIFYFIVGLVLYIALMRLFFFKYISTMFTLFFRATLRQQQLREQLLQAPLPALLMNIFFVISISAYCSFLALYYHLSFATDFWTTLFYTILLIASVYTVKYIFLHIVGWIFGISNVSDTYIFIVFLINKMIGIFLIPVIALLAFPTPALLPAVLTISYILIAGMLFYRFIISYRPVRSEIKLNRFQFFLYLCAFEIAPLLLIYKVLLTFVDPSLKN